MDHIRETCELKRAYVNDLNSWISDMPSSKSLKEQANRLVQSQDWDRAVEVYTRALALECEDIRQSILSNRSLCYLKKGRYLECIDDCCNANNIRSSAKAWFRKAQAEFELKRWTACRASLKHCDAHADSLLAKLDAEETKHAQTISRESRYRICNVIPEWCRNNERDPLRPVHVDTPETVPENKPHVQIIPKSLPPKVLERYIPRSARMSASKEC